MATQLLLLSYHYIDSSHSTFIQGSDNSRKMTWKAKYDYVAVCACEQDKTFHSHILAKYIAAKNRERFLSFRYLILLYPWNMRCQLSYFTTISSYCF